MELQGDDGEADDQEVSRLALPASSSTPVGRPATWGFATARLRLDWRRRGAVGGRGEVEGEMVA